MAENKLKWYNILAVLFGTILSFADPVTDILTLVEFYRANHKMWFGVGLVFIILPSLLFLFAKKTEASVRFGNTHVFSSLDAIHSFRAG